MRCRGQCGHIHSINSKNRRIGRYRGVSGGIGRDKQPHIGILENNKYIIGNKEEQCKGMGLCVRVFIDKQKAC